MGCRWLVHGDDFVFEKPASSFDGIIAALQSHWIIKVRAVLGPDAGDAKEVSILNRVVRWQGDTMEYEADPRHVEKLLRDMHMEDCKPLSSPGVKVTADELEEDGKPLVGEAVTLYRSGAARCNYLSVDRPDIPFATKEMCRSMSRPMESDMANVKHACRYLKGRRRLVQKLVARGVPVWELHVYVDSDCAGCRRTRKSTSGGCMVLNGNCLKTWSTTQAVRALSSGEAEYYAGLKGAIMALGFLSMAADLGEEVNIILRSDSSAALGIIGRRGLGKVRHMETGYLWLQDIVSMKRLSVKKVKGVDNPADLGTKHLKFEDIAKHLELIGFHFKDGRTTAVPGIHKEGSSDPSLLSVCVCVCASRKWRRSG